MLPNRKKNPPQVHPQRAGMKPRIHEEFRHGMRRHRLPVDGCNEHALMARPAQPLLPARTKKMRQTGG
jgi:hypothetical protein